MDGTLSGIDGTVNGSRNTKHGIKTLNLSAIEAENTAIGANFATSLDRPVTVYGRRSLRGSEAGRGTTRANSVAPL